MTTDEDRWAGPLDIAQVGELTARWLEGAGWAPWQCGDPPDAETGRLVAYLAAMNRLGYATDFSQPGESDGSQRACVEGYCDEAHAGRLSSLSLETELVVITHYPGVDATYEIPITRYEGRTETILAGRLTESGLWEPVHPITVGTFGAAYHVAVLDPQWGRDSLLWPNVIAALQRSDGTNGLIQVD